MLRVIYTPAHKHTHRFIRPLKCLSKMGTYALVSFKFSKELKNKQLSKFLVQKSSGNKASQIN